jgi:hypothetical protein
MHPDNTVICQVKISRAAMQQEAAKAAKAPVKGKKNNIFSSYLKASVVKLVLFFINISSAFLDFQILTFQKQNTASPSLSAIHFNLLSAKNGFFITIRAILSLPLGKPYTLPPKFIIISLTTI